MTTHIRASKQEPRMISGACGCMYSVSSSRAPTFVGNGARERVDCLKCLQVVPLPRTHLLMPGIRLSALKTLCDIYADDAEVAYDLVTDNDHRENVTCEGCKRVLAETDDTVRLPAAGRRPA